jgi:glycosyltransferase involved in cell wall biosynthesis
MEYVIDVNIACYNHEKYIAQTIEGVLAQKTNFPFRILIGDDCSSDQSAAIIKSYQERFPTIIEAYYHPVNLGLEGPETNGIFLLKKSNAKYITLLDGDDYWIDSGKLQKQIDFLETNPDFSICFHAVQYKYMDTENKYEISGEDQKQITTFEDLTQKNYINGSSCIFRNTFYNKISEWEWILKVSARDWAIFLIAAQFGKIYFMKEVMAVYRINTSSSWANQSELLMLQRIIVTLNVFEKEFAKKYLMFFRRTKSHYFMEMSGIYHKQLNKLKEIIYFYKACMTSDRYEMNMKDVLHKAKEVIRN